MDACTVEVGLLRKHPCGEAAVAHCENCEQSLCSKHAIAQTSPSGGRTGKFMCAQCHEAAKAIAKSEAAAAAKKAIAPKPPAAAPAARRPAEPPKPAEAPKPSAPLDFNPGKPPAPEKKPEPAPAAKPAASPAAGGKFELSIEHSAPPEPKPNDKK